MKKIYGFAFAAAIMSLASCSNETEPVNNPVPEPAGEAGGYVAINIVNPAGTRADSDGFKDGTSKENKAEYGTFLFFNDDKVQTQAPQTVKFLYGKDEEGNDIDKDWSNSKKPGIERVSSAMVVVGGADEGDAITNQPTQLLVILNDPSTNIYADYTGKDLDQVLKMISDQSVSTENEFIMTNARAKFKISVDGTETDQTKLTTATDITGHVHKTRLDATSDAVNVYVERLAAKVDYAYGDNQDAVIKTTDEFSQMDENGEVIKLKLKPVIKGIDLANQAQVEYLFKNLDPNWENDATLDKWLFDVSMYRSNWALTPEATDGNSWKNQSWNDYKPGEGKVIPTEFYVRENTDADNYTSLLLTAQLVNAADNTPVSLVRWGGLYFTPDGFKTQALNFVSHLYKKKNATEYESLAITDLKYLDEDGYTENDEDGTSTSALAAAIANTSLKFQEWEQALQIVADKVYTKSKDADNKDVFTEASLDEANAMLMEKSKRVWYWNNGQTYYFVNIKHDGTKGTIEVGEEDAKTKVDYDFTTGIVRNNWYQLTINNISGLGTPVFDPDRVIIPDTPDEQLWYIGAKINILNWRLVAQPVDINQVPL